MLLDISRVGILYQKVWLRLRIKNLCLRVQSMQQPITDCIRQMRVYRCLDLKDMRVLWFMDAILVLFCVFQWVCPTFAKAVR